MASRVGDDLFQYATVGEKRNDAEHFDCSDVHMLFHGVFAYLAELSILYFDVIFIEIISRALKRVGI